MRCLDNSVVTLDRIEDTQRQINFYKEHVKTGDWSDTFYDRHLAILELGLRLIRDKLSDIVTEEDWVAFYTTEEFIMQGVHEEVIKFIANVLYHQGPENTEVIRSLFRAGYCYYFAQMLKDAFGRGTVCLAYPFGHIVWEDDNGIAYDIEGVNKEYERLIPISKMGNGIKDFKHVDDEVSGLSDTTIELWLKHFERMDAKDVPSLDEMLLTAANNGIKPKPYKDLVKEVLEEQHLNVDIDTFMSNLPDVELDKEMLTNLVKEIKN